MVDEPHVYVCVCIPACAHKQGSCMQCMCPSMLISCLLEDCYTYSVCLMQASIVNTAWFIAIVVSQNPLLHNVTTAVCMKLNCNLCACSKAQIPMLHNNLNMYMGFFSARVRCSQFDS